MLSVQGAVTTAPFTLNKEKTFIVYQIQGAVVTTPYDFPLP